ncbi:MULTISPECIES: FUSC family protein [unclassified Chelatococcus]|uniref:FUSC family protein n=1 Tax=unclassified Chelatococcus TaxID=2638111 RepID=UPI001BD131BF|nr:FUSC family protein [Chelatococcus sp.]MBS7738135.1 FUSC family protein [Chelatococcus sp. HY11]CAH1668887.1 putative membrane protein YccC [Hyphomicrobiales bacterium]MBX3546918.1 FUSC family protein [Chelatococcus sp.]MCO5077519.1 FUSC family protein [Chelatococcus sp.]CAH1678887.1 putative membrane protein YccC [Hyphomicrobiales bacterium]
MRTGSDQHANARTYRPPGWLRNVARLNPNTAWPWRHSIRIAIAVAVPLLVGHFTDLRDPALLVCLGALLNSVKVQSDSYLARLQRQLIAAPIAGLGYVVGATVAGHGALSLILLVGIAFASGLISGYGAAFSTAAMQMLVLAIIGASVHSDAPLWLPPLLFMGGSAFAAALLGCEALLDRRLPERATLAHIVNAMARVADAEPQAPGSKGPPDTATPIERARRGLTDAIAKGYAGLLDSRRGDEGPSDRQERSAAILSTMELISAEIVGNADDRGLMHSVAARLNQIAQALTERHEPPPPSYARPATCRLLRYIDRLTEELWPSSAVDATPAPLSAPHAAARVPRRLSIPSYELLHGKLVLGREVVLAAAQLALCIGIAVVAERHAPGARSYWIPLTVAIVLKPDFGSVFVRAVQRSIGTVAGVAIGVAIMTLLPKGLILIVVMTVLAAAIPWAGLRGYALQCTFLTPFVLIMIDVSTPGATVDYAAQRLVDTVLGAAITLVFGYLIWPRSPGAHIGKSFAAAMQAVADYLAAAGRGANGNDNDLMAARRAAYHSLSNVRTTLQRALSEPPPASSEAAAWFPVIVNAERLCDHITRFVETRHEQDPVEDERAIAARVAVLRSLKAAAHPGNQRDASALPQPPSDDGGAINDIDFEINRLSHLLHAVRTPSRHARRH